jgi:hypothetical protein
MLKRLMLAAAIAPLLGSTALAQATPPYHIAKIVALGHPTAGTISCSTVTPIASMSRMAIG